MLLVVGNWFVHRFEHVTQVSNGHKLLMAALMAGECGSDGLPGYSF